MTGNRTRSRKGKDVTCPKTDALFSISIFFLFRFRFSVTWLMNIPSSARGSLLTVPTRFTRRYHSHPPYPASIRHRYLPKPPRQEAVDNKKLGQGDAALIELVEAVESNPRIISTGRTSFPFRLKKKRKVKIQSVVNTPQEQNKDTTNSKSTSPAGENWSTSWGKDGP